MVTSTKLYLTCFLFVLVTNDYVAPIHDKTRYTAPSVLLFYKPARCHSLSQIKPREPTHQRYSSCPTCAFFLGLKKYGLPSCGKQQDRLLGFAWLGGPEQQLAWHRKLMICGTTTRCFSFKLVSVSSWYQKGYHLVI